MPRTTTVRLAEHSHALLRELASQERVPLQEVLERAIEAYRRDRILDATNAAYAALRADSVGWQDQIDERAAWDTTLADGLQQLP
jgi:predicted nucleic acid-binding protein